LILALLLAPAYKIIGSLWNPGPRPVDSESARLGRLLFVHKWTAKDSLAHGDGLGPVFNATSCVECHSQPAAGGAGPISRNVT
jgi:CxxC motif-containing protein (DUF1111 family)